MGPLDSWTEELRSAYLYRVLAVKEADAVKARLFEALAGAAEEQAQVWAAKLPEGAPPFTPDLRTHVVAGLVRLLGPRPIRPVLASMKVRGLSVYGAKAPIGHVMPTSLEDFGHRHRAVGGGNLRASVFGVSDGLVSNASLILGVAGASAAPSVIVLSGMAGMLAGAFSMAAGEYVSVRSQRELYEYQIGLEAEELDEYPEEEAAEIALIYEARGLEREEARSVASSLMKDRDQALDTLAREELGLNPDDLGSPTGAALASFVSFALGAALPLTPYLLAPARSPLITTAVLTGLSLFGVGCALSLFTGRSALWSGLRMALIGGAAGLATWWIGSLFGAGVTG